MENNISLIAWGTKDGSQVFFSSANADKTQVNIRHSDKDVRSVVEINTLNTNFYSIELEANNIVYNIYKSIHDWRNRKGILALSLIVPHDVKFQDNVFHLMNALMNIYETRYLDDNLRIKRESENQKLFEDAINNFNSNISKRRHTPYSRLATQKAYIEYDEPKTVKAFFKNAYLEKFGKYKEVFFITNSQERGIPKIRPAYSLINISNEVAPEDPVDYAKFEIIPPKHTKLDYPFFAKINGVSEEISSHIFYQRIPKDKKITIEIVDTKNDYIPFEHTYTNLSENDNYEINIKNTFNLEVEVFESENHDLFNDICKIQLLKDDGSGDGPPKPCHNGKQTFSNLSISQNYKIQAYNDDYESKIQRLNYNKEKDEKNIIRLTLIKKPEPKTVIKQQKGIKESTKTNQENKINSVSTLSTYKIHVQDKKGTPISNAKLSVGEKSSFTDKNGNVDIKLKKAKYIVTISTPNMNYRDEEIILYPNQQNNYKVILNLKYNLYKIIGVILIPLFLFAGVYFGYNKYQSNQSFSKAKTQLLNENQTKIEDYQVQVDVIEKEIKLKHDAFNQKEKKDDDLNEKFKEALQAPDVLSILNKSEVIPMIEGLSSMDELEEINNDINSYYEKVEKALAKYQQQNNELGDLPLETVATETKKEDENNADNNEVITDSEKPAQSEKQKVEKPRVDKNAKRRNELKELSKGIVSTDNAEKYKVEVDVNKCGFEKNERKFLMEKFDLLHSLFRAIYNVENDLDRMTNVKEIKLIYKTKKDKLTKTQREHLERKAEENGISLN